MNDMYKHYKEDKEIEDLLRNTSGAFSPNPLHFKKILSSIDIDSSLTLKESPYKNSYSTYSVLMSTYTRFAGAAFVFVIALFGAKSYINISPGSLTDIGRVESIQTENTPATGGASETTNLAMNTVESPATFIVQPSQDATQAASLRTAKTNVPLHTEEQQALGRSLSQELTADQQAADDLLAIAE
jgi:hypothetical protein